MLCKYLREPAVFSATIQFSSSHNFRIHSSRLFVHSWFFFPFSVSSHSQVSQSCAVAVDFATEPNFPMHVSEDHRERALNMQVHLAGLSTSKILHYARKGPLRDQLLLVACLCLFVSVPVDSVVWILLLLLLPLLPSLCTWPHLASSFAYLRMWALTYELIIFV